ncbi:MAG: hypothetical protein NUV73_02425 [Candidatus Daviesbacteria bacterium]|nr:hypothetical protein [Candidatus Daviesbacteria bacterium]
MNKTTKILLSLVGLGAIIVPAVLLVVLSQKINTNQAPANTNRTINSGAIENIVNQSPQNYPVVLPTATPQPKPASPSAHMTPEGSPSAQ